MCIYVVRHLSWLYISCRQAEEWEKILCVSNLWFRCWPIRCLLIVSFLVIFCFKCIYLGRTYFLYMHSPTLTDMHIENRDFYLKTRINQCCLKLFLLRVYCCFWTQSQDIAWGFIIHLKSCKYVVVIETIWSWNF